MLKTPRITGTTQMEDALFRCPHPCSDSDCLRGHRSTNLLESLRNDWSCILRPFLFDEYNRDSRSRGLPRADPPE
jgi:hypothetical protein